MKTLCAISAVVLAASMLACAQSRPAAPATQPAFGGLVYHRTGGFVGTDDRITITPAGQITISGRLVGKGEGQLKADQLARLVELFEDWGKLKGDYKPKDVVNDGFETEIRYGEKTVHHSDGAEDVPESLQRILRHLPELANSITRPGQ